MSNNNNNPQDQKCQQPNGNGYHPEFLKEFTPEQQYRLGQAHPALAAALRVAYAEELNEPTQPEEARVLKSWEDLDRVIGPIEFVWPVWLPLGLLTIVASESGRGKSALMLRIADSFIRDRPWPDGKPFEKEPGYVLWCEAEASQAINLGRAKEWGIPLKYLRSPLDDLLEDFKLDNPAHRGALAGAAFRPEMKLIAIDSLSGADSKAEKSTEDSTGVKWLAELARDSGKPVLLSHHLRKRSIFDSDVVTLDRLRGASSITQFARVVWALDVPDPHDKENIRLHMIKNNLARFADPIGMLWGKNGLVFGKPPETPKTEGVTERAIDLLMSILQDEPMEYDDVVREYKSAGISEATVNRAKKKLGIVSAKRDNKTYWSLPTKGVGSVN